jgi:hypothetical protein
MRQILDWMSCITTFCYLSDAIGCGITPGSLRTGVLR